MRFFLLLSLVFFVGCVNTGYDPNSETNKLVVYGYLYANQPVSIVKVGWALHYGNPEDSIVQHETPIEDAVVTITCDTTEKLLEHTSGGKYQALDLIIQIGKTYKIEVIVKDTINDRDIIATAKTTVPQKLDPPVLSTDTLYCKTYATLWDVEDPRPGLTMTINNPDHQFYIFDVKTAEQNPEQIITSFFPSTFFYPVNGDNQEIVLVKHFYCYGKNAVFIYNVNDELVDFIFNANSMQNISLPNEGVTNIINGYGLFTAVTSSDSTFFTVIKK